MPEEQSRPLSPFKTYREFVATQRDDADPQTFSRRYQDYRGTFARELVRRFFERNADFEWFRERYDPSRIEARCEAQRARAAAEAAAFRENIDDAAGFVAGCSLDPAAEEAPEAPAEGADAAVAFERSRQCVPGHAAARVVLLPGCPPVAGAKALGAAVALAVEDARGQRDDAPAVAPPRVLLDDAAPRRKDGFDVDAWLLFDDADAARDAEKALGDGRLDVAVPPALAASPPPWDPTACRPCGDRRRSRDGDDAGPDDGDDGAALDAARGRLAKALGRELLERDSFRARAKRALLSASVGAVDEFGRGARPRRGPRPYDRAGAALGSRDRLARDCAQALAAAAAYDDAADVPGGDRLAALVAGDTDLGAALRADNGACLDVAAAYLRRVHLVLYYGATRCKDEIDLLTRDVAWLTRPAVADAPGSPDEEAEKLAAATADLAARLEAKARRAAPKAPRDDDDGGSSRKKRLRGDDDDDADDDGDEPTDEAPKAADPPKDEPAADDGGAADPPKDADGAKDWGKVLADMDDALCRLIAAARREAADDGGDDGSGVCPGRAYHPRGAAARLFAAENAAVDRATEAFYAETGAAEDNGRARCGFEWCRKLFKSQDFLRKHGANRHGDYLEQFVTAARRPFMWAVYELDGQKPLPPIRTDAGAEVEPLELLGGKADRKRGRDRDRRDRRDDRRDDRRGRADSYGDRRKPFSPRDRRDDRTREPRRDRSAGPPKAPPGAPKSSDPRKPPSYNDVDAPKRAVLSLDYGVLLPPPAKKKKNK